MAKIEKIGNIQIVDNKEDKFFYFPMISMACTGSGDGKERDARRVEKRLFGNPSYACRLYPYSCGRGVCIHDLMIRWGWSENKKEVQLQKMMLLNLFFCCNLLFRCFHRELFQEVNDGVA